MTFANLLRSFSTMHVTVVGDVMLDEYIFTRASRISPEAPVMIVQQKSRRSVPGGAANVARNIVALGGSASIIGVAGDDEAGQELSRGLKMENLKGHIFHDPERPTTRKTRIVADHSHQVLRIDHETEQAVPFELSQKVIEAVAAEVKGSNCLLISDYTKGVLSESVVQRCLELAKAAKVPLIANAKPKSARWYAGADLVTFNRHEAAAILGHSIATDDAVAAARVLCDQIQAQGVVITLGEDGMAACGKDFAVHVPAPQVEAYDAAGAGDTGVACLALGGASWGFEPIVFQLAVQAAARVVRHVGVAIPTEDDLREIRALKAGAVAVEKS